MEINGKLIKQYIQDHKPKQAKMERMLNRYTNDIVPIQRKAVSKAANVNNKIINPYHKIIVDQVIGYLFGSPVTFTLNKSGYNEIDYTKGDAELRRFKIRNHIDDLLAELGKQASIMGYGSALMYIDTRGKERIIKTAAQNTIFIYDTGEELTLAIRYYDVTVKENGKTVKRTLAEVYDNRYIYYFIENKDGEFIPEVKKRGKKQIRTYYIEHQFKFIPLRELPNNEERTGDFEIVETQIDAIDRLLSNAQDEIEAFRNAYLKLINGELTEEQMLRIKETGVFELDEDQDVEFVTKQINDVLIENQKKTLNENIYKFAAAIDMSDEKFAGNQSGVAQKYKLMMLENKAKIKERKFTKSLREIFKVLTSIWHIKEIPVDYLDIEFTFSRNIPIDLEHQANIAQKLKGFVSEDTRLKHLDIVDDVEEEKQKIKEDIQAEIEGQIDVELVNSLLDKQEGNE